MKLCGMYRTSDVALVPLADFTLDAPKVHLPRELEVSPFSRRISGIIHTYVWQADTQVRNPHCVCISLNQLMTQFLFSPCFRIQIK